MSGAVSSYLLAAGIAFLSAQVVKYFINGQVGRRKGWRQLYASGRMPSAHTATMAALTTSVLIYDGAGSGLFAVVFVLALITAYDSMMSRRSVGEQGMALKKVLAKTLPKEPAPYVALGHTPLEVAVGALWGVSISIFVAFFITK
jgi:acid phosphatase family membrane protein YuiD